MTPEQEELIRRVAVDVRARLEGEGSGHDWWHSLRVWNMAKHIGALEHADLFVVELAALLHDIADWKDYDGDVLVGPRVAREILESHEVSNDVQEKVSEIIEHLSFKGAGTSSEMKTLEGSVVQDADRLDAIGAVGIARTFTYGGNKSRPIHDPDLALSPNHTKEEYIQKGGRTGVNHFYEKLLLLKDLMNTKSAKEVAEERHQFMLDFLEQFFAEWEGLR